MKIILVGSCVKKDEMINYPALSVAGNKMLLGFAEGFAQNNCSVDVVSVTPRAMIRFKKNGEPFFQKRITYKEKGVNYTLIDYCNFFGLKQITVYKSILKELKRIIREHKENTKEKIVVFVYNTISYFAKPVVKFCNKKEIMKCGIIADLPILKKKSLLHRIEDKEQIKLVSKFDALVSLTEYIGKDFAPNIPQCVVEAGVSNESYDHCNSSEKNDKKTIVYSGSLNELSGIDVALKAMNFIDDKNIVLNIYGDGSFRKDVEQASAVDKRIQYCGHIDNKTMLKIQQSADLLICPRKKDNFTTKYTFPSKILEYCCSGTPVLCNKLLGVPTEYDNYVNFAIDENPAIWAEKIEEILCDSEGLYKQKALNAKNILLNKKSWKKQTKKIIEFLKDLNK